MLLPWLGCGCRPLSLAAAATPSALLAVATVRYCTAYSSVLHSTV